LPGNLLRAEEYYTYTASRPDHERYELIDGAIVSIASPVSIHQRIAGELYRQCANFLEGNECIPYIAPFDVELSRSDVCQPDVFIVCDKSKDTGPRIVGAPDFAAEVVSPSSVTMDYVIKRSKYLDYGVREYWIIDPRHENLTRITRSSVDSFALYDAPVEISIFPGLFIDLRRLKP